MCQQFVAMLIPLLLATLFVTGFSWTHAQLDPLIGLTNGQEVILIVEGLSAPEDGLATTGSNLAIEDALRKAVQQVARSYFDSDAMFDNHQGLQESIALGSLDADTPDVARLIRIVGQGFGGDGIYRVTAEVAVKRTWLERDLRNLVLTNNDTRIVVISADNIASSPAPMLLSDVRGHLTDLGYNVVMDTAQNPYDLHTASSVADTALRFGADLALVVDLWFHENMTPPAALERVGLHSATVGLAFDLVSVADGSVVYSDSDARPATGISTEAAIQQALDELVSSLQVDLEAHLVKWTQTNVANSYTLKIDQVSDFEQLNNVVSYLDNYAQAVTMRAYGDGRGIIELDYSGAPDELVRLLAQEGLAITQLHGHTIRAHTLE
jgi:hypothetical protein